MIMDIVVICMLCINENSLCLVLPGEGKKAREFVEEAAGISVTEAL